MRKFDPDLAVAAGVIVVVFVLIAFVLNLDGPPEFEPEEAPSPTSLSCPRCDLIEVMEVSPAGRSINPALGSITLEVRTKRGPIKHYEDLTGITWQGDTITVYRGDQ